jgi:hypothetical protein
MPREFVFYGGVLFLSVGIGILGYWYVILQEVKQEFLDEYKDL